MLRRGKRLRNRRPEKLIASTASTPVGSNAIIMEVLDRNNYKHWRSRLETYLLAEDLWEVVQAIGEPPKLEDDRSEVHKAWTKKNAKALYAIQNSCGRDLFSLINEIKTAKDAWEALEREFKVFQGYDENNADHLVRFELFVKSVRSGDWDKAKKCLGEIDVRSVVLRTVDGWRDGTTTLHVAAWEGQGHIVKELVHLMSQEDVKTKNSIGHTALHLAAEKGHAQVVKELPVLLMGEVQDKDGDTALHNAVHSGKVAAVKELVLSMREEDLKIKNHDGYTALHLAVNKADIHMLKAFMTKDEGGSNNGKDDFERFIPFTTHVTNGDWDKTNGCLTELDDPLNAITARNPNNEGMTALHAAAKAGHVHVIKELVSLLEKRQEELELKTAQDFRVFGLGVKLDVGDGVVMEKAKYMVEQYEKTVGNILEIQSAFDDTALHLAAWKGHLNVVKELAPLMRQEGFELKQKNGSLTALHLAIEEGQVQIAIELMHWMRSEALEEVDGDGLTSLSRAVERFKDEDLCKIAKIMAEKNDKVFSISSPPDDEIPVVSALRLVKKRSVRYIYSVTPPDALQVNGCDFICYCLEAGNTIDLAWELLQRHPNLAFPQDTKGPPLLKLASMRSAFLSGSRLKFWQRWLYNCISIPQLAHVNMHDISLNVAESKDDHRDFISSEKSLFRRFANGLYVFCGIESIYEMKSKHKRISQLIQCIGEATRNNNLAPAQFNVVKKSIFKAIAHGHFEFVTQLWKANRKLLIDISDEKKRSIFHVAVENRLKEVYSLLYEVEEVERIDITSLFVNSEDTMLYYASNLFSLSQFDSLQDSSLQMQRELQWFQEVESVVPIEILEYRRSSDDLTARELFTKNHKKLIEDAENSTKGIATSCTVVGALIVTMMFAAAFTVPGGNNGETGFPLLLHNKFFKVFIILDTISLVSSITSVITFLGMLTSRYAEDDFLKSLPTKMMIGLFTLFFSIVSMMIAFSCALIILLDGEEWIVIPSIMCCGVPVVSFIWFLFPFLGKIFISTYGPGIFDKSQKIKP